MIQYKQLVQARENSTNAASIYANSNDTRQAQLFIKIANVSTTNAYCRVFNDDSGSTFDQSTAIFYDFLIRPGETLEVDHVLVNNTSARIGYRSSVANALTITVYGIIDLL
jgi:hypothetical protein